MIHITKDQLNKIDLTLRELSILTDPEEYHFIFTSEDSKDIVVELTTEPTTSTERIQTFEITEGTDVTFDLPGYYSYEVYQTAQNNLVETGLLRVLGAEEAPIVYPESGKTQVYGG